MKLRSRKAALYALIGFVTMMQLVFTRTTDASTTNESNGKAGYADNAATTASYVENSRSIVGSLETETDKPKTIFTGKAIALTDPYLEVMTEASEEAEVIGKLYNYNIADVVQQEGQWTRITSGNLNGYVKTQALVFGEEAEAVAKLMTDVSATVNNDHAWVCADIEADSEPIATAMAGTVAKPLSTLNGYVYVQFEDGVQGYMSKDNISIDFGFSTGVTIEEEEAEAARIAAEEAALEAERQRAEEARLEAERQAQREAELRQRVIANTISGTDITYNPTMTVTDDEIWLLACLIDYEAGWEPYEGKLAVANVVLNRVRSSRYANTMAGVIYSPSQFSGVSDGNYNPSAKFQGYLNNGPRTQECMQAALEALSGINNIGSYTSFLSTRIANYSAYSTFVVIGGHCFH